MFALPRGGYYAANKVSRNRVAYKGDPCLDLLLELDAVYHEGCRSGDRRLRCVVSRDVTAHIGPTKKISVALLVNVLHYREEEKLDIVESRASVIGCRSMRRWQRSLLCAE